MLICNISKQLLIILLSSICGVRVHNYDALYYIIMIGVGLYISSIFAVIATAVWENLLLKNFVISSVLC